MNRATTTNILLLLLWLAVLGLIAWFLLHPPRLQSTTPNALDMQLPQVGGQVAQSFELPELAHYQEIVERPLFQATRRPPVAEETLAPVPEAEPEDPDAEFTLIGVVVMPQGTVALLHNKETGKVNRLKVGEAAEKWQLETVEPERVVLRKGERTQELLLERNKRQPKINQEALRRQQALERAEQIKQQRRLAAQQRRAQRSVDEDQASSQLADAEQDPSQEAPAQSDSPTDDTPENGATPSSQ